MTAESDGRQLWGRIVLTGVMWGRIVLTGVMWGRIVLTGVMWDRIVLTGLVCVGTVNSMFIYRAQKGKWLSVLVRKDGTILSTQLSPPNLTLNTNPPLHLTLPATHRPAAVLLLLTV